MLVVAGWAFAACTAPTEDPSARCDAAREHLATCLDVDVPVGTCDAKAAETVLAQSCAALADPGKADLFDDALCALGALYACTVPACPVATSEATCAAYLAREDCSQCDYYLCREQQAPCGTTGYYAGFAYPYCQRYRRVTAPLVSAARA